MILRYILAWIPMVFIGIINGVIRQVTYGKYFSELRAHQVSSASGVLLLGLYIWTIAHLWGFDSPKQAIAVGLLWLGLTVIFEFTFGHFVAGHSWSKLLSDYNILAGRIWLVVLIWVAIAPWLFSRFLA
ncbi:MAG: hypothetical protein N4J56_002954 [Chroococcidiopsis sp. SAG 2025]|uniref:hypothetical protein n=1 Tax=Chroococcidiopsis sp. SAG 2025 TaxID=171389 RepID=UPI002936E6C4|nr:hypothetical protein [Chroococcidiopsis sp. SAG 2025]MDV2993300.1 hypothetical protein [Chroococcidiopsis sp. SAG 2025]